MWAALPNSASSLVLLSADSETGLTIEYSVLGLCEHLEVIGSYAFQNQLYKHKSPSEQQPGEARPCPVRGAVL